MIYTVTISPAIDYIMYIDDVKEGSTNRACFEEYHLGGKGINVSRVLKELGHDSVILGFVGGFTGLALEEGLKELGLNTDFVHVSDGITRINVKVRAMEETEINSQGTHIPDEDMEKLLYKLDNMKSGDVLVLSGSIPKSMAEDTYFKIIDRVKGKNINIVLDTTGASLKHALKCKPFLVKPNLQELEDTLGHFDSLESGAKALMKMGARNVLISKGKMGASLFTEDGEVYECGIAEGELHSTVGAGDSMVAGFIAGYMESGNYEYALQMGSAAGCATAYSQGLATKEDILKCFTLLRKE